MNASAWLRGLRLKLMLLVVVPALLIGGLAFIAIKSIRNLTASLETAALERLPLANLSGDMTESIHATTRFLWSCPLILIIRLIAPSQRKKSRDM